MAALFEVDGDRLVSTAWSRGPWDPGFLHGGPVAKLGGRSKEPSTSPCKRVQLLEATISGPDGDAARATGLRIRKAPTEVPPEVEEPPTPGPEQLAPWTRSWAEQLDAFHSRGVEIRPVDGSSMSPGLVWIRAQLPIVEGEELTPLQRALAAADFPNGVSLRLDPARYLSINPELTVHLHREPEGEWVHLAARTFISPDGTGVAEGVLSDLRGRFGRSMQSLMLEPRRAKRR